MTSSYPIPRAAPVTAREVGSCGQRGTTCGGGCEVGLTEVDGLLGLAHVCMCDVVSRLTRLMSWSLVVEIRVVAVVGRYMFVDRVIIKSSGSNDHGICTPRVGSRTSLRAGSRLSINLLCPYPRSPYQSSPNDQASIHTRQMPVLCVLRSLDLWISGL